ncbi:hypothetical protein PA10_00156 [Pseudomonas phage pPa_SNUABM_DT01]|nr:hypothetical protein PA10_00156 [Pseudomonas phage pPa_SNUABM_DT01]
MQIHIHELSGKGITMLRLEHKGEQLLLSAGSYHSAAIINREVLFKETNEFLKSLPDEDQDRLWSIYQRVDDYLSSEEIRSSFFIRAEVERVVKELYQIIGYPQLRAFIDKIRPDIPGDVSEKFEEFNERGRNYRSRTYIKPDYLDLVAMALGLRFMVPVWGMYIQNVSSINGNGYKESEAVKLIELAGVDKWPPYIRMNEYIEASVEKEVSMTMVMAGLSSEEVPRHLMAMALVRKISIGPLSTTQERDSLARILFNYVTGTHLRMDGRFASVTGIVQAKRHRNLDKGDEDNSSVLDDYNQTTEITEGDRQMIEVFSENVAVIVNRAAPDLDLARVQQCISVCSRHEARPVEAFQKAIVFWVLRSISPEARELLLKRTHFRLMGIAQAILDHWGFHELAILVSAEEYIHEDGEAFIPMETRNKITRQQAEILDKQYPYYRQESKRQDPGKRGNVAVIAIDQVVDWMSGRAWKPHAPRDIIEKIPLLSQTGYLYISGDIRRQLADMIIRVNNNLGSQHATA